LTNEGEKKDYDNAWDRLTNLHYPEKWSGARYRQEIIIFVMIEIFPISVIICRIFIIANMTSQDIIVS
jgi:hypothetical protein